MMGLREALAKINGPAMTIAEAEAVRAARGLRPVGSKRTSPSVVVRTYANATDYERDAASMTEMGYLPQGHTQAPGKINMGRTLGKAVTFLPWALMRPSRQRGSLTVTWAHSERVQHDRDRRPEL
jgi:hypothetical protein